MVYRSSSRHARCYIKYGGEGKIAKQLLAREDGGVNYHGTFISLDTA